MIFQLKKGQLPRQMEAQLQSSIDCFEFSYQHGLGSAFEDDQSN